MRMGEEIIADSGAAVDDYVRQQYRVPSNFDFLVDHDVRSNVRAVADLGRRMHDCRRMHARLISWRLAEKFEGVGESQVGILATQQGGRDHGKLIGHNDRGSSRSPRRASVFGISDEGKLSRPGFFNASDATDLMIGRAIFQPCAKSGGNLSEFHRL